MHIYVYAMCIYAYAYKDKQSQFNKNLACIVQLPVPSHSTHLEKSPQIIVDEVMKMNWEQ